MPEPRNSPTVWNDALLANPHAVADKQSRVRRMFAAIAGSYDLNNHLHSLWMDQYWRRRAVQLAALKPTDSVLDAACGTGDLTLKFASELQIQNAKCKVQNETRVIGLDYTFEMLPIARRKSDLSNLKSQLPNPQSEISNLKSQIPDLKSPISWLNADAMRLPLPDACTDVVSIAFGIRNVADPQLALREFHRVLRPGGRVIILEFSLPKNPLLRGLYNFYFRRVLPVTATIISGDRTGAYKYLPESVNTFIGRERMLEMMTTAGFVDGSQFPLTFGVCVCYRGVKN
ncbi:MAG: class I SAM-dependent methyltransferase [Tepidisphaeraceae bacterium]|jgi:demethylmenaquinone methyltransferase/2-methoxy-6-polyprenyl-1,4-benzoquinol methylase